MPLPSFPPKSASRAAKSTPARSNSTPNAKVKSAKADAHKRKRQKAWRWGFHAEYLAALALLLKGYKILAFRYAARGGEIDIIARRSNIIAFIEVKSRRDIMSAALAIDAAKQRRMSLAAKAWIQANPKAFHKPFQLTLRGDAVYVIPWRWPRHVSAAIPLDLG